MQIWVYNFSHTFVLASLNTFKKPKSKFDISTANSSYFWIYMYMYMYVLTVHIAKKIIWGTNPLLNWEKFKYL